MFFDFICYCWTNNNSESNWQEMNESHHLKKFTVSTVSGKNSNDETKFASWFLVDFSFLSLSGRRGPTFSSKFVQNVFISFIHLMFHWKFLASRDFFSIKNSFWNFGKVPTFYSFKHWRIQRKETNRKNTNNLTKFSVRDGRLN